MQINRTEMTPKTKMNRDFLESAKIRPISNMDSIPLVVLASSDDYLCEFDAATFASQYFNTRTL